MDVEALVFLLDKFSSADPGWRYGFDDSGQIIAGGGRSVKDGCYMGGGFSKVGRIIFVHGFHGKHGILRVLDRDPCRPCYSVYPQRFLSSDFGKTILQGHGFLKKRSASLR